MTRHSYDIGIRAAHFISVKDSPLKKIQRFDVSVERDQFIGVSGSKITRICSWKVFEAETAQNQSIDLANESAVSAACKSAAKEWLDGSRHVVMPGLVNAHTHLPMSLLRGLADDAPLQQWLHEIIFPLEANLADEEFCKTGTSLSLLEGIRYGTTTFGDMYFHQGAIADVALQSRVRAVLGEAILDFPSPDNPKADANVAFRMIDELRFRLKDSEKVEVACGPHAPYTCSDSTLRRANDFALEKGLKILIHVSENETEVMDSLKQFGKTPVQRLQDLGMLRKGVSLAHAVFLNDHDRTLLEESGASVVHNPESNMKLGSGAAPVIDYLRRRIPVGLGTDGAASNNNLNLFQEMDTAAKLQKLAASDNTAMTAASALYLATLGGAHALGMDDRIGSLEEGKEADLLLLSLDHPHLQPVHDIVSAVVYSANGSEVETVLCGGVVLFHQNEWKTLDKKAVFHAVSIQDERIRRFTKK